MTTEAVRATACRRRKPRGRTEGEAGDKEEPEWGREVTARERIARDQALSTFEARYKLQ
jgi:hypothetical protein